MKLSRREAVIGLATVIVALFGVSAVLAKPIFGRWAELRRDRATTLLQIEKDKMLAGERGRWSKRFGEISDVAPPFPADKKMDTHWASVVSGLAEKNRITLSKWQPVPILDDRRGDKKRDDKKAETVYEKKIGPGLYEMSIKCQDWMGTLDALVHFLFDLQQEGAMLEIQELTAKPKSKTELQGGFTFHCVYARQEAGK